MDTIAPPAVITHMAAVLQALPAIGKNQRNTQQNFDFRGIDDVLNAINPLLGDHGLIIIPNVLERTESVRTTGAGKALYVVNLHVGFTVYCAEDGSSISGSAWGEGTDSGDKATNKAMTGAFKYFLFEAFAISTKEASDNDADRHSPPETERQIFECPRCEESGTHFEHINRDKFREHMVTKHGYRLLEDGRVAKPVSETDPTPGDPGPEPRPATYPDDGGRPVDPPKVDGPEVTETAETVRIEQVASMAKQQLVMELRKVGLSTAGTIAALRERLTNYLGVKDTLPADEEPEPKTTPEPAANAPAPTGHNPNLEAAQKHGISTDLFIPDGQPHQCPECTEFPFDSEGEYQLHWYERHDPDREEPQVTYPKGESAPAQPETLESAAAGTTGPEPQTEAGSGDMDDDGTPASEALIAQVKETVGQLTGDQARAYARYRREKNLPAPMQLTFVQAIQLIDWLEANAPTTV